MTEEVITQIREIASRFLEGVEVSDEDIGFIVESAFELTETDEEKAALVFHLLIRCLIERNRDEQAIELEKQLSLRAPTSLLLPRVLGEYMLAREPVLEKLQPLMESVSDIGRFAMLQVAAESVHHFEDSEIRDLSAIIAREPREFDKQGLLRFLQSTIARLTLNTETLGNLQKACCAHGKRGQYADSVTHIESEMMQEIDSISSSLDDVRSTPEHVDGLLRQLCSDILVLGSTDKVRQGLQELKDGFSNESAALIDGVLAAAVQLPE